MKLRILLVVICLLPVSPMLAQTSSFTYQGRLSDGGTAANGNYDLQFALFDSLSGGAQVGSTQTLNTVAVGNGIFTVSLDFGASAFNGANRFLEISARPSGSGAFTLLTPRQQVTSTPYAVRSLIASSADSVPASGIPVGSGNYIQNSASPQASSNFNISGTGTANIVNATKQYNLNGGRILSSPGDFNLFVGGSAGGSNTTGFGNSFFGVNTGQVNTTGPGNTFVGEGAGFGNTTGQENSFFGLSTGGGNGSFNSFFGSQTGTSMTTGSANSFFGRGTGINATGNSNTFVGSDANFAGESPSGDKNTLIGANTTIGTSPVSSPANATAIGANARVDDGNSLVLGSINGVNGATASVNVGIGTTTPATRLHVVGTTGLIGNLGIGTTTPARAVQIGSDINALFTLEGTSGSPNAGYIRFGDNTGWKLHFGRNRNSSVGALNTGTNGVVMTIQDNGQVGIGTTAPDQVLSVNGNASKSGGGSWASFSDERLKNIKGSFTPGLKSVMQLQPLRYEYKPDNPLQLKSEGEHVGFSAQQVQRILPEAVMKDAQGYLLVNNDPILWTMLNAIKEQQKEIEQQRQQISVLKKLVCQSNRRALVCR